MAIPIYEVCMGCRHAKSVHKNEGLGGNTKCSLLGCSCPYFSMPGGIVHDSMNVCACGHLAGRHWHAPGGTSMVRGPIRGCNDCSCGQFRYSPPDDVYGTVPGCLAFLCVGALLYVGLFAFGTASARQFSLSRQK